MFGFSGGIFKMKKSIIHCHACGLEIKDPYHLWICFDCEHKYNSKIRGKYIESFVKEFGFFIYLKQGIDYKLYWKIKKFSNNFFKQIKIRRKDKI